MKMHEVQSEKDTQHMTYMALFLKVWKKTKQTSEGMEPVVERNAPPGGTESFVRKVEGRRCTEDFVAWPHVEIYRCMAFEAAV